MSQGLLPQRSDGRWQYEIYEELIFDDDLGEFCTYGIRSLDQSAFVKDISTDKAFIVRITAQFNRCQLSPLHFMDVIEDLLP